MNDKLKHSIVGIVLYIMGLILYYFTNQIILIFLPCFIIGGAKEIIYDKLMKKGTYDLYDFLNTIIPFLYKIKK